MSDRPPKITIESVNNAMWLLREQPEDFDAVISINNPLLDDGPPPVVERFGEQGGHVCAMLFDDLRFGETGPQAHHIEEIVAFARKTGPCRMLVHCTAGVARSSAAALIVASVWSGETVQPTSILDPKWHWPNPRMLELADEALGTDLGYQVDRWLKTHTAHGQWTAPKGKTK